MKPFKEQAKRDWFMQSVFLVAAAAYCIRAAALWGKDRGWMALISDFCCFRLVGDGASLENVLVEEFKI